MDNKIKKTIYLSQDSIDKLEEIKEAFELTDNEGIEQVIQNYDLEKEVRLYNFRYICPSCGKIYQGSKDRISEKCNVCKQKN